MKGIEAHGDGCGRLGSGNDLLPCRLGGLRGAHIDCAGRERKCSDSQKSISYRRTPAENGSGCSRGIHVWRG